jgi:hypothetical protein
MTSEFEGYLPNGQCLRFVQFVTQKSESYFWTNPNVGLQFQRRFSFFGVVLSIIQEGAAGEVAVPEI